MTNIVSGSGALFFQTKKEIVAHVLKNVLANHNRMLGTEWEMFFVDGKGKAITRAAGQKAFTEFNRVFIQQGYGAVYTHEQAVNGRRTITGLDINGLGLITPEMGHQWEFSCSTSSNPGEIRGKNQAFFLAAHEVAKRLNYVPLFQGHVPGYSASTEGSYRSRSVQWRKYYDRRFGIKADFVREGLEATASTQVTIDSGAENFHEFFRALLLIEPAFTLHYANSDRPHIGMHRLPGAYMNPVIDVWNAHDTQEALEVIVDRLMKVEVPFLPDTEHPSLYKAEILSSNRSPTIQDLMQLGRLNEEALNNASGFFLARPAFRKPSLGLIEMRGVDSQPTPDKVAEVAARVASLVYDDTARRRLLADYAHLQTKHIKTLHEAAASPMAERHKALNSEVAGMKIAAFVQDIIARSTPEAPAPRHEQADMPTRQAGVASPG